MPSGSRRFQAAKYACATSIGAAIVVMMSSSRSLQRDATPIPDISPDHSSRYCVSEVIRPL